jgi:hypothetical protein
MSVKIFSNNGFSGQYVKFTIGNQTFSLQEIIEDTKEDEKQTVIFYKEMLKKAFENLGIEVELEKNYL